jgi:hypothetical protein
MPPACGSQPHIEEHPTPLEERWRTIPHARRPHCSADSWRHVTVGGVAARCGAMKQVWMRSAAEHGGRGCKP